MTDRPAWTADEADPVRAAARPWWWAAGATVLATAAAVAVVTVVSDGSDAPAHHHHDMAMDSPASTQLVAAYFWGMAPNSAYLFREFGEVPAGDAGVSGVAVQQVVYTLQAAAGERWPVKFFHAGQLVGRPVTASPARLSPVSISDPAEGNEYAGSFTARGRVLSTELLLDWDVLDGQTVVASGNATIDTGNGSFSPWSAEVDLSGLAPGRYTFRASTGNVGYGAEPSTDTRTINVR